jgi:hypothetical protein
VTAKKWLTYVERGRCGKFKMLDSQMTLRAYTLQVQQIIGRKEARDRGLTTYFTGEPCRNGHVAERYCSTCNCVVCLKDHGDAARRSNPEAHRAKVRAYSKRHPERVAAKDARWRAANLDRAKSTSRRTAKQYYDRSPEQARAASGRWQREHPEAVANYVRKARAKNPGKYRARVAARRASIKMAMPPWANREAIAAIYEECARLILLTDQKLEVDHVHPLIGRDFCGLHVDYNLQIIPAAANRRKSNRLPEPI